MLRQDDPYRCTAAKLVKFNLVHRVHYLHKDMLVLNPFAKVILSPQDSKISTSVCAIDCSWVRADDIFKYRKIIFHGIGRRLPLLLAANPTNYSRVGMLSTAEALSGSLYILGFKERAAVLMNKFKWGHTFLELNASLLEEYANAKNSREIADLEKSYFPHLY
jgi:rRNA small subunit aminocarboxypropyltransferase